MITLFKTFLMNESIDNTSITKVNLAIEKDSVSITNNPTLLKIIIDYQMESYENNEKNLTKNLVIELTELFGRQNRSLRFEFSTKLWILKYKDLIFNVYTSKKGTSIEICGYTYEQINKGERQADIIDFLDNLYLLINGIPPGELDLRRAAKKYNL